MKPTVTTSPRRRSARLTGLLVVLIVLAPTAASATKGDDPKPPHTRRGQDGTTTSDRGNTPPAGERAGQTANLRPDNGTGQPEPGSGRSTPDARPGGNDKSGTNNGNGRRNEQGTTGADNGRSNTPERPGQGPNNSRTSDGETSRNAETPRTYIVTFTANTRPAETGRALVAAVNENNRRAELARGRNTSQNTPAATYIRSFEKVLNAAVITVPPSAVPGLRRNPRVLSIEEDTQILLDPSAVSGPAASWGLDRIDQRALPLSGTYSAPSSAADVTAYVVDTGIDASHPDFTGRVTAGFDAIGGGGDCNGHGTHVAGTIAGKTYGVAKEARLVPVRVLGCDGSGTWSGVIAGLDWIAKNRPAGQRAVANMSLGGGASSSVDSAVASLVASGVTVVAAAGNSNTDACTTSPARAAAAITVGATTTTDARAIYSNYGSCLDLFAPGSSITSTIPGGGTATYSGTSMAAPHVAGIAAIMLSLRDLTPAELAAQMTAVATSGMVSAAGTNSPNLLAFLPQDSSTETPAASTPAQPEAPLAEARSKAAIVSWTLPDDGGATITAQTVRAYTGTRLVATVRVDGATTAVRVTRLKAGTDYTFTVQSTNRVGTGLESPRSNPIRPTR